MSGIASGAQVEIDPDLDADQRAAVTHPSERLRISAPPGSGKTRVLTRRVAWRIGRDHSPNRSLVVTFTRRAAHELRHRLGGTGLPEAQIGTLHAIALHQLGQRADDRGRAGPRVVGSIETVLAEIRPGLDRSRRAGLASAVAWAGARGVGSGDYADASVSAGRSDSLPVDEIAAVIADYHAWKRKRGLLDFDDLLAAWTLALTDDPVFGRAQRWRLRDIYVDEFQDLTPTQFAALSALVDDDTSVTVVGDPDQAIYGFNGADVALFAELPRHLDGFASVELSRSYRCPSEILDAAVLSLDRAAIVAARAGGFVGEMAFDDDRHEAAGIAGLLSRARAAGRDPGDVAVLARTHAVVDRLSRDLASRGVPVAAAAERHRDAATLATFHSAKGLEWPIVILAGVEDGLVPHSSAADARALAEERRLLYVAMTRAQESLYVTWTRTRRRGDRSVSSERSPWVGHLRTVSAEEPNEQLRIEPVPSRSTPASGHDRIDEWRRGLARRAGCDPETILTRRRIDDLVESPPHDLDELCARLGWGPALREGAGRQLLDTLTSTGNRPRSDDAVSPVRSAPEPG